MNQEGAIIIGESYHALSSMENRTPTGARCRTLSDQLGTGFVVASSPTPASSSLGNTDLTSTLAGQSYTAVTLVTVLTDFPLGASTLTPSSSTLKHAPCTRASTLITQPVGMRNSYHRT